MTDPGPVSPTITPPATAPADPLAVDPLAADPQATDDGLNDGLNGRSMVRTVTPGDLWRKLRVPLLLLLIIALTAFGTSFFRQRLREGALDPESATPLGSRALAQLLDQRGIAVKRVNTYPESAERITVFMPFAGELAPTEINDLISASAGANLVLVGVTGQLNVEGVDIDGSGGASRRVLPPDCDFAPAVTAGSINAGGVGYRFDAGENAVGCYGGNGAPSVVNIASEGGGDVTLVGSSEAFTNKALDDEGNAAFTLGLLDRGVPVTWVMRRPAGSAPSGEEKSLGDLLPAGVGWGFLQLLIAACVAMLWRGRRLGPVVIEALPVVVRAAEAVEGRGRLYAAGKARGRAGWNLRRGARTRLRTRLALPADASNDAIVESAATRTNRPAADISRLLYGPDPVDDAGLVRLAADLDNLDSEVRRS